MPSLRDRIRDVLKTTRVDASDLLAAGAEESAVSIAAAVEADLESVLGGERRGQAGQSLFVVECRREPTAMHGLDSVATIAHRLHENATEAAVATGSPASTPFVFFDVETTGLSGGAGTYAFLIGCGGFTGDGAFVTRQYVLDRPADEQALLSSFASELHAAGAIVSFNGKSFDAPLLETRYLYHRLEWTGGRLPHIDMLHVARRFWRRDRDPQGLAGDPRCSLISLEQDVLDLRRNGDVPGFEIPSRYFRFVRTGDADQLKAVLEHNRLDLLSLAALTARSLQLVRLGSGHARDSREALALGYAYWRAGLISRARGAFERAIELGDGQRLRSWSTGSSSVVVEALRALAIISRKARSHDDAARYWSRVLDAEECPDRVAREANTALAIHHEHRVRDLEAARAFALRSFDSDPHRTWNDAVRHRLARLEQKIERREPVMGRFVFDEPDAPVAVDSRR